MAALPFVACNFHASTGGPGHLRAGQPDGDRRFLRSVVQANPVFRSIDRGPPYVSRELGELEYNTGVGLELKTQR